jgi:ectoine hydroxylase-related dioxygenase (phytanoyl-CoA dioxygenase family)
MPQEINELQQARTEVYTYCKAMLGEGYWCETPKAGDLLVFPGSLEHQVRPNTSEAVRISIAFNFKN